MIVATINKFEENGFKATLKMLKYESVVSRIISLKAFMLIMQSVHVYSRKCLPAESTSSVCSIWAVER